MDIVLCHKCSAEIEGKEIAFRGQVFCSDECCEEFENRVLAKGVPAPRELDDLEEESDSEDLDETSLGYVDDAEYSADGDPLDDDFDIRPEDF